MENSVDKKLVSFLKQLGLKTDQATIYLYLLANGPSTVLAISRGLSTGRTKLYPALESMVNRHVLVSREKHYGTSYEAQPPENLEFLVADLQRKADIARHEFGSSLFKLKNMHNSSPSSVRIEEYRGVDGLKQMMWNLSSKATDQYRSYELQAPGKYPGINAHFIAKLRSLETDRKLTTYTLTNNPKRKAETDTSTQKVGLISTEVFSIEQETYIYNNVVALFSGNGDALYGIEIYSEKLAQQYRQLFDVIWNQSTSLM